MFCAIAFITEIITLYMEAEKKRNERAEKWKRKKKKEKKMIKKIEKRIRSASEGA